MCDLDAGQCSGSGVESLEPHHVFDDPLDETVILLKDVVEVFHLMDLDAFAACDLQYHIDSLQPRKFCTAIVDENPLWNSVGGHGLTE